MENASKALIIAAEILLGIMLISIFVLMYTAWSNFSNTINTNIQDTEINEFNAKFTIYDNRTDLTVHDIITVVSLANEYNLDKEESTYKIKITGNAISSIQALMNDIPTFIINNQEKKFTLKIIEYNKYNKIVDTIRINKNQG